jgi:alpha-beta hydrolase superfamily lysophospholipase
MSNLTMADGLLINVREWPCEDARGTVIIVHGLGEHIGRYEHVAQELRKTGRNVVGYDHRGHGASQGRRGAMPRNDSMLRDLAVVIDAVRMRQPGPLVLLGHSMGGVIAARMVAGGLEANKPDWYRPVDALVLSSPALDLGMTDGQKRLLAFLGPVAPGLAIGNGLEPEWISRDAAVVKAYVDDPLVHDRVTPRLVRFLLTGGEFVRANAAAWRVPTLLLYAGSDRCVAPAGSAAFEAAAPKNVVTTKVFEPLFHEIFNEPEQADVFAVMSEWLSPSAVRASRSR